ncbi:MAG: DNA-binding domain-containing protein [Proteobacteria bacterium]|nr:DNA-binding domain-containing protein [Pseudomonadota bacterium]
MSRLSDIQQQFSDYLLSQSEAIADFIVEDERVNKQTRLEIYKNAYAIRLTKCIETDHPMLGKYLGDDLFETMAKGYINHHPSHYTSLRYYCDDLPGYLDNTEPFTSAPILTEIAAFERTMLDAFDTADDKRASVEDLKSIQAEKWPAIQIGFHSSVRVFTTCWNSVESWQALKDDNTPPEAIKDSPQYWLVWRGVDLLTQFRSLTNEGHILFNYFDSGANYADVCEVLLPHVPEHQISELSLAYIFEWLSSGLIKSIIIDN